MPLVSIRRPHSTFLDIGSGYGKVVLHLRLMARMRRSVGMEYVKSRDDIAKQALFALESEVCATGAAKGVAKQETLAQGKGRGDLKDAKSSRIQEITDDDQRPASRVSTSSAPDDEGSTLLPHPPQYITSGPVSYTHLTLPTILLV